MYPGDLFMLPPTPRRGIETPLHSHLLCLLSLISTILWSLVHVGFIPGRSGVCAVDVVAVVLGLMLVFNYKRRRFAIDQLNEGKKCGTRISVLLEKCSKVVLIFMCVFWFELDLCFTRCSSLLCLSRWGVVFDHSVLFFVGLCVGGEGRDYVNLIVSHFLW